MFGFRCIKDEYGWTAYLTGYDDSVASRNVRLLGERLRGELGWDMSVQDVLLGHRVLGFDYPMQGDQRLNDETPDQ